MNKIIVTGMPRSGTSETMGVLFDAGYSIRGEQWPHWYLPEMRQFQPDGYWESLEVCNGINTANMPEDAVKIMLTSIFDCTLDDSDIVILCERDAEAMAESQKQIGYYRREEDRGWQRSENARLYARFNAWEGPQRLTVIRKNHEFWLGNQVAENARILSAISNARTKIKAVK